jgi:hypothetical protein
MVVAYNAPERISRGRPYKNTPYYYMCSRRHPDGRLTFCQNPAGPYIDRAVRELVLFALGELDLDGLKGTLDEREEKVRETTRLRLQQVEVLDRRARMLEEAIGDAKTAEARARLVAKFEEVLGELDAARKTAAAPAVQESAALSKELLGRLEVFRDPEAAWERFGQKTRKEIVRALAKTVSVHPDSDGYILLVEWEGGGRAAAKVDTMRRRKLYPIPDEVSALFGEELGHENVSCRVASRSWTSCRSLRPTCSIHCASPWRPEP